MDATSSWSSVFGRVQGWAALWSLLVALIILGIASIQMRDDLRLRREGVTVEAEIIGKGKHASRMPNHHIRSTKYDISYAFVLPDGREVTGSAPVSRKDYERLQIGSVVKVVYWPTSPRLNRLEGRSNGGTAFATAAAFGVIVSGWISCARALFAARAIVARNRGEAIIARVVAHHEKPSDPGWWVRINSVVIAGMKERWLDWSAPGVPTRSTLSLTPNELLEHPVGSELTVYRHPKHRGFLISAAEVGIRPGPVAMTKVVNL